MSLKDDIELIRSQLDYGPGSNGASEALSRIEAALEEKAWLIEIPMTTFRGPPVWWTGNYKTGSLNDQWSDDSLKAVRFSRKEDAEAVITGTLRLKEAVATGHVWG